MVGGWLDEGIIFSPLVSPRIMASLDHILVLCVGLLAMARAGKSGETAHYPPQTQAWQESGKP